MKLDRETVAALSAVGKRREIADDELPGLRLMVSPSGARSWSVLCTGPTGKRVRVSVGSALTITPKQARERARQLAAEVRLGHSTPKRPRGGPTIGSLVEAFQKSHDWQQLADKTRRNWSDYLRLHILPALGKLAPESVTRNDVRKWAGDIAREAPTSANRSFEVLRRVYNWSADGELIRCANPCARLAKPAPERPRERVYSTEELKRIVAGSAGTGVEVLVPLLMLTALRSGEARAIRLGWLSKTLLTIPAEASKNGAMHPVPVTMDLQLLLWGVEGGGVSPVSAARAAAKARGVAEGDAPLFPANTREGFVGSPHQILRRVGEACGVVDLRAHDLRRTAASVMEELGAEGDTIEAALGHSRPSLKRTYRPSFPETKVRTALRDLAVYYREQLGLAWWEPDANRRAAIAAQLERFEV